VIQCTAEIVYDLADFKAHTLGERAKVGEMLDTNDMET
jgi:hypothetical protein